MKKHLILILAFTAATLLSACGDQGGTNTANKPANASNNASANTAAATADNSAEIKKLMADLGTALAKNDTDAAAKFYSDDYHLVTPQGVDQTKAERIADMKSGKSKFESFEYTNISVRNYGDTAVAIATVNAKGVISGNPTTGANLATLVWHKDKDGWKVVSGQATPVLAGANQAKSGETKTATNANTNTNSTSKTGNSNK